MDVWQHEGWAEGLRSVLSTHCACTGLVGKCPDWLRAELWLTEDASLREDGKRSRRETRMRTHPYDMYSSQNKTKHLDIKTT